MQQAEELKKFRWLFFLLVPAFAVSINIVLFGTRYFTEWRLFSLSTLLLLAVTTVLSAMQISLANWMRDRIQQEDKLIRRLLLGAIIALPLTAIVVALVLFCYDRLSIFGYHFSSAHLIWGLVVGVVSDIIGIAMNEGIYGYSKWKETQLEAEKLSKEKLQTQLNSLLQQINPHFLFNSLNALSALIAEDPVKAQKFLTDLSRVYRYLLRTNEDELATLATELSFIDSYFDLLQTRFGIGVELVKAIDPESKASLLPPLTLQLLVENAVKHNQVSKSQPLKIEIISTAEKLTVRNNLQKKIIRAAGSKIGLSNIAEKYRLINKSTIDIQETDGYFAVSVPLIRAGDTFS